jgi:amino acid adenylation domain-containing protein
MFRSLIDRFIESAEAYPDRPALVVDRQKVSYQELKRLATRISQTILQHQASNSALIAIFGSRTITAYAAILGAHAAGNGYTPLNPRFPAERNRTILQMSGANIVVVDRKSIGQLADILFGIGERLTVILPDTTDACSLSSVFPKHRFITENRLDNPADNIIRAQADAVAYLLFTSGSTGQPKGVPIRQSNVEAYIDYAVARYDINNEDRVSQEFDLTFDLSVHDMFVCWERGACLYCVPEKDIMFPLHFIRDNQLTMWFSVPSVVRTLARVRLLQPGCLPSLRWSLFCGEPLCTAYASAWGNAAQNSIVENLYGPTEATIAISHYRWDAVRSPAECLNDIVPIGWIFEGQQCCVISDDRRILPPGDEGQLCLRGSQVANGYWNNTESTAQHFCKLSDSRDEPWYLTGDVVIQGTNGCHYYLGRTDQQVKIRGYRVELQEVESVLRRICGTDQVVAAPWPIMQGTAEGLVAFLCNTNCLSEREILQTCRKLLPDYMVPKTLVQVNEIPLTPNGKTDKNALIQLMEA